jgi:hypothetical protein
MTATRVSVSWHPELGGKSRRSESPFFVHVEDREITCAEIRGALFSTGQLRAIAEDVGWQWERFVEHVRFLAEDQRAPFDFVPVECRYVG